MRSLRRAVVPLAGLIAAGCLDLGTEPWNPVVLDPAGEHETHTSTVGQTKPGECPRADGVPVEVNVEMVQNAFHPAVVWICAGDTITWINRDSKEHTVFTGTPETPNGTVASRQLYFGERYSHTFEAPGRYVYYCSTHKKKMKDAEVNVQ